MVPQPVQRPDARLDNDVGEDSMASSPYASPSLRLSFSEQTKTRSNRPSHRRSILSYASASLCRRMLIFRRTGLPHQFALLAADPRFEVIQIDLDDGCRIGAPQMECVRGEVDPEGMDQIEFLARQETGGLAQPSRVRERSSNGQRRPNADLPEF